MIKDILLKRKTERRQPNIDVNDNSWDIVFIHWVSDKHKPIWMILNTYQLFPFIISCVRNWVNSCPRWLLNKNNIKIELCSENCIYNLIVFLDILWKDFYVFNNHTSMPFTDEQIDCFWFSWIFTYFLECYSLLNLWCQNGHSFESAWWLPLQLEHLNECRQGLFFLVLSLGGLVFLLAL